MLFSGFANILQLTTSVYMMQVFDRVMNGRSLDTLVYLTLIAAVALGVLAVLEAVRARVMERVGAWIEKHASRPSFERALENSLRGAAYQAEALRDLGLVRSFLASPTMLAVFDLPWVPIYLLLTVFLHPLIGLVALIGVATMVALAIVNERTTSPLFRAANESAMLAQRRASGIVRHAELIDSMGMAPNMLRIWSAVSSQGERTMRRALDRSALFVSVTKFLRLAFQIAILGVGAYLSLTEHLSAGTAIAGSIVMARALAPIEQVFGAWRNIVQARQAWQRLQGFLSRQGMGRSDRALPRPTGRIAVEQLSFAFPGQARPSIRGMSFELAPGEVLAVIGPSAAGKSTLIRLLTGTLQPSAGAVRLDGADVFRWQRSDFGRHVGYLPQEVCLFDGTVFENIARMGEARPDDVYEAARLAGCHDMILRLPQGYDTRIGDDGQHLSGGQKQMVGLARAMFGQPVFVVLDEPNSNLDGDAELDLMRAVRRLSDRGTTVVLVSHGPRLVQACDTVLVMREGAVSLLGPRDDVLASLRQRNAPNTPAVAPVPSVAAVPEPSGKLMQAHA
ncbi:MAG: type I secretion system permease/ATPase [Alphaproteobacteria bacterium]|nr:type I secretion system permease/ATPase [Alphaproteobacteria bacterium]